LAAQHARRADQIVVISQHTATDVETRFGVPASRISICVPGAPRWERRECEPDAGGCLLFVGTLEPRKNLDLLLDAYGKLIAELPGVPPLILAGRIEPESEPILARLRRPPFAGRVETTGYVDDAAKRALFGRAIAFVMPSHTEGFGIPALEAMVTGVPVVAADRGALPEAVGEAGRLFDATSADALAVTLRDVLTHAELRNQMREIGWAHASTFTWTRTAQQMREAWHRAIEHKAARRG
jgi:glycosyltransferase involved in cell wall biosynthesis